MTPEETQSNFNIPNILSVIRILLTPLALWGMVQEEYLFALSILIIAGITDALDGFLARKFDQLTPMGRALDPLADKILFISVFLTMGFGLHLFPEWFAWMILLRDFLILVGFVALVLANKNRTIAPTRSGKIHTVLLFVFLCLVLLSLSYGTLIPLNLLMYGMALSTAISFLDYLRLWVKRMAE
ncbi:MAG TPA: CDP-diacylglycerol--glycerol-3-phosphate 3-phosphatidyltransferase [Holosporales bacterium]|nr:CDP-diacylglycerol--glycerol-3-phosphate 3-phosphatidyltransferase [Holosporales bacterium]